MDAVEKISDYIVDIGIEAVKDKIKTAQEESAIRRRLNDFLERQYKYNLSCTLEEEIDFQGIAEYIRGDLLEDVKRRLFGNVIECCVDKKDTDKNQANKMPEYILNQEILAEKERESLIFKSDLTFQKVYASEMQKYPQSSFEPLWGYCLSAIVTYASFVYDSLVVLVMALS